MTSRRLPFAITALLSFMASSFYAATVPEWRSDIEQIVTDIRTNHPAPFTKYGELSFLRRVASLERSLPALTEEQRVVELMKIVALIGDGHTQLAPHRESFGYWYPVRIYEFTDGVFITSAHRSVAGLAGAQILEIAGHPVAEVLERARELMGCDNSLDCLERIYAIHSVPLMKGLGYAAPDGSLQVRVRLADGNTVDRVLQPHVADNPRYDKNDSTFEWQFRRELFGPPAGADSEWVTAFRGIAAEDFRKPDPSRPPHFVYVHRFTMLPIPEHDAYYIQEGQTSDDMVAGFEKALRAIDEQKPRRLIVDLRYNFGGDGSHVSKIAHYFIEREAAPPWKELYVLSGRKTFSAGLMTLAALLANAPVSVVGEPAGAALNSYGDPTEKVYPVTGLVLNVSTVRHQLSGSRDISEYVPVDVPAQFSYAQWARGEDPAVDAILRGDEMRSISLIARTDGGAAAKRTYEDRKRRFARIGWWIPPPEIDLRNACQELRASNRLDDALQTCELSTEIHPFIWNTWYNLAHVQIAVGLLPESLANYHHVLELDPQNFNGAEIREAFERGLRPRAVKFGATVAQTQAALNGSCKTSQTRRIDPPFLGGVQHEQVQIDCEGFPFLGKLRHAEFVFRDDSLVMSWIMTSKEERAAIVRAFTTTYGESTSRNAKYVVFAKNRAAVRLDRDEVLFYSEAADADVVPEL